MTDIGHELLDEVKASRDELRAERDDWRNRAERLLTDQRAKPASKVSEIISRMKATRAA